MAHQKRKPAKAKPITSNPLFPAVVALWFGALFGLGSLAVRPALLEALVLGSRIDLFIPAAAPPLGVTARILLALAMAALGAMLGIMLARRLSRPAPEAYDRKRGTKDLTTQSPRTRARDSHPDAPARRPISAHEELGSEHAVAADRAPTSGPGMLANRRRALAIIDDEPHFVPHDLAPLPGGGAIHPLDLATLALTDVPAQLQTAAIPATVPLDWSQPAPVAAQELPEVAPVMGGPQHQAFQPEPLPPLALEPVLAQAAHHAGRQVFGMAPLEPLAEVPRQIFGVVAEGDHLPQNFVRAAGFQLSVFDTPTASPLFDRAASDSASVVVAPADTKSIAPSPSPASLGMTDLAARLAEAMRRRRELAQRPLAGIATSPAGAAVQHAPAPEIPATALPATFASPAAAPVPAEPEFGSPLAMPAAMRPLALDAFLEDDAPFDTSLLPPRHFIMTAPVAPPTGFTAPVAPDMTQPAAASDDNEPADDDHLTADNADNAYASLLGVTPQRQTFVRIDEPAADPHEAAEPVVIFPGQAPPVASLAPAAPATGEDNAFRRFDAPASAGQGQPIAANSAAATGDPAEAAQALRAALSNLQRMSGAA